MRRMYSENQIKTIAGAVATEIVEDNVPHLYELQLSYSDTTFSVYTKSHGAFALNTEYTLLDTEDSYLLSDELTSSLIDILTEIGVGNYNGIPFTVVSDESTVFINKSYKTALYFENGNGGTIIEVYLDSKTVSGSNREEWNFKFTQIF